MVNALASRLTNQITWKLLVKVFFFSLALLIVSWSGFSLASLVLFFLILLALYWSKTPSRRRVRFSFWFVPILALIAVKFLTSLWFFLATFFAIAAFSITLALSHLLFKNQFLFYEILHTVIIFGLAAVYFGIGKGNLAEHLIFFAAITLLFSESFDFFGFIAKKRKLLAAAVIGLIALETSLVLSFLPLGVLNSAAYLTLFLVLIRDCLTVYRSGLLSRKFLLSELTLFVILSVIVFASSGWQI